MFYCLIDAIPIGTGQPADKRLIRTFIMGSICHAITYILLSSGLVASDPIVSLFKQWYWMICGIDLSMLGIINKGFFGYEWIKGILCGETLPMITDQNQPTVLAHEPPIPEVQAPAPTPEPIAKPRPVQEHRSASISSKDELDIDLLTENDVDVDLDVDDSDVLTTEVAADTTIPPTDAAPANIVVSPTDTVAPPSDAVVVVSETKDTCNPKLTEDNINKYVIGKQKIITTVSVKSEDLNLQ